MRIPDILVEDHDSPKSKDRVLKKRRVNEAVFISPTESSADSTHQTMTTQTNGNELSNPSHAVATNHSLSNVSTFCKEPNWAASLQQDKKVAAASVRTGGVPWSHQLEPGSSWTAPVAKMY